jgi:hypothetical protein
MRYKDTLNATMKNFEIDHENWESLAVDRPSWRALIYDGAVAYESKRHNAAIDKRQRRKAGIINSAVSNQVPHPRSPCGRVFRARIGLTSHLKQTSSTPRHSGWSSSSTMDKQQQQLRLISM